MIKVNLLKIKRKSTGSSQAFGIDFNKINLKAVLISFSISFFFPDLYKTMIYEEEIARYDTQIQNLDTKLAELLQQIKENEELQNQIQKFNDEEKVLLAKLEIVKQIIKIQNNPMQILLYVSNNTPDDLWLDTLDLEGNQFVVKGKSVSYKSIGQFIESLKKGVFFNGVRLVTSKTVDEKELGIRTEEFEISAQIVKF